LKDGDGKQWSANAAPVKELMNYDDIVVPAGETVLIGRWDLTTLRYSEGGLVRGAGQLTFQALRPGKYQLQWWDGVFQIGTPLRSSCIEVSVLREDLSAQEFAAVLRGRWESVFVLPGRTNIAHAEFRADDMATVVVTAGDAVRDYAGPYRLEFERPPATGMVTLARITVQAQEGDLALSRVSFGLHSGVSHGRMLLRIDGNPYGALDRDPPWGEPVEGVQVRLTTSNPRCESAPSLKLEVAVIECPEPQVTVPRTGRSFEIEVDGRWYHWGDAVDEEAFMLDASRPPMELNWCWPGPWVAMDGKEPRSLVFKPGRHTVRVGLVVHPDGDPDGTRQIRLLSNPVEVVVVGTPGDSEPARPGAAATGMPLDFLQQLTEMSALVFEGTSNLVAAADTIVVGTVAEAALGSAAFEESPFRHVVFLHVNVETNRVLWTRWPVPPTLTVTHQRTFQSTRHMNAELASLKNRSFVFLLQQPSPRTRPYYSPVDAEHFRRDLSELDAVRALLKTKPAPDLRADFTIQCRNQDDSITAGVEDNRVVFDLRSTRGIGAATIVRQTAAWPYPMILRLHLGGLESLTINSGEQTLRVSVQSHGDYRRRLERVAKTVSDEDAKCLRAFTHDGQPTGKLPDQGGWFELELTPALNKADALTINWIDFHR
jgi:hypothetical protein